MSNNAAGYPLPCPLLQAEEGVAPSRFFNAAIKARIHPEWLTQRLGHP
jgi:hypothetical protein